MTTNRTIRRRLKAKQRKQTAKARRMGVCFWCKQKRETVLFDRMLTPAQDHNGVTVDYDPCDKCKTKMSMGVTFAEKDISGAPTGQWFVLGEDCLEGIEPSELREQVRQKRFAWLPQSAFNEIGSTSGGNDG